MKLERGLIMFLLAANCTMLAANWPTLRGYWNAPAGVTFSFVHMTDIDYYLYLSTIRQGADGAWETRAVYTSEPTKPSIFYLFYLAVGHIAKFFHISPIAAYHVSHILSQEMLFVGVYILVREMVGVRWAILAALIGFFTSVPPIMYIRALWPVFSGSRWWDNLDPLFRADYLPHHAFGTALTMISLWGCIKLTKAFRWKWLGIAVVSAIATALVYSPPALVLALALPLACGIEQLHRLRAHKRIEIRKVAAFGLVSLAVVLTLVVMRSQTDKGFPWSQWRVWDMSMWNNNVSFFNRQFFWGLGIMIIFALPYAVGTMIRGGDFPTILSATWFLLPLVLLFYADLLGVGRIRLGNIGQFVPMGVLAVKTLQWVYSYANGSRQKQLILYGFLLVFVVTTVPSSLFFLRGRLTNPPGGTNVNIPYGEIRAFGYVRDHIPAGSVVLASFSASNMLPAFAPVVSYWGHWTQTKDFDRKSYEAENFFRGSLGPEYALAFLRQRGIGYIYIEADARAMGDITGYHLPVERIYDADGIAIYKLL